MILPPAIVDVIQITVASMPRLRLSSWNGGGNLINKNGKFNAAGVRNASRVLDDISLLRTVVNDANMKVDWDRAAYRFLNKPGGDAERVTVYNEIIDGCHKAGVQCLIGYGLVPLHKDDLPSLIRANLASAAAFNAWLLNPGKPTVDQFAQDVAAFVTKTFPACDGISFDIEDIRAKVDPTDAKLQTMKTNLVSFYQKVADKIGPQMMVGIATGGMTSDTEVAPGQKPGVANYLTHPYSMAVGHPNIVLRPMAYDFKPGRGTEADILKWHTQVVEFAVKTVPRSQFQLGVRTMAGGAGGAVPNGGDVKKRCSSILRGNDVGLILFPDSESLWKPCNESLNPPPAVKAGTQQGLPKQAPLDKVTFPRVKP